MSGDTTETHAAQAEPDYSLITLDRERNYATCHGEGEAKYMQGPFYFDAHGVLLPEMLDGPARAELGRQAREAQAQAIAQQAYEKAMKDAGLEPDPNVKITAQAAAAPTAGQKFDNPASGEEMDLVAWAKGTATYNYPAAVKEFKRRYSRVVTSKANALTVLKDLNLA